MSKVSRIRRSSSPSRASPVRHNDAYASVQVASPRGYSSRKSASTLTTPSAAGEGRRRPLPGRSGPPGSDIREDLDLRHAPDPRSPHGLAQARVVSEALGLLDGREFVSDEQVVAVGRYLHHALRGAAVPSS